MQVKGSQLRVAVGAVEGRGGRRVHGQPEADREHRTGRELIVEQASGRIQTGVREELRRNIVDEEPAEEVPADIHGLLQRILPIREGEPPKLPGEPDAGDDDNEGNQGHLDQI